jgi:tetratricopeptide (TPR) repeat protein
MPGYAGQRGAPPARGGNQPAPSGGGKSPNTNPSPQPTLQPTAAPDQPDNSNNTPRPTVTIVLMGTLKLLDGKPVPPNVSVHVYCGINTERNSAFADPQGNFSLMLNVASDSDFLFGCGVRARLGGYESSEIPLERRSPLDDPNVGTIYLRPFSGDVKKDFEGYTVSLTTKLAPKDARKEYEKGLESVKKEKWPEAEQEFLKAVTIYPKYAIAWFELGRIYDQEKRLDDADQAEKKAIEIEPKFISPYSELAMVAFAQAKWADVVQYTSQILKLAPFTTPQVHFYNAAANFNLHNLDDAEESARTAAVLDEKHKIPRINEILGLILAEKHDFKGAAENLRMYLQLRPAAPDAATVQQQLADIEKAASGQ